MQQLIVISPPNDDSETEALKCQFEHYLKMMDVFETRQTWVFNFAILVYLGALATSGPLLEHLIKPGMEALSGGKDVTPFVELLVVTCTCLYSVLLPLLVLPLCYLYVDVSIFCAALSAGVLRRLEKRFGAGYSDPGGLAINWIYKINEERSCWHWLLRTRRLDIDRFAHGRTLIFLLAPTAGLAVACVGLFAKQNFPNLSDWSGWTSGFGILVSLITFVLTWVACHQALDARLESRKVRTNIARKEENSAAPNAQP